MLAPIQAALEDLFVPNKFADAFSCNHINHEVGWSRMLSKVAIQCCSTNVYEDFHVDSDTDERVTRLDEFVGPQLEPQCPLHQSGELLKALEALNRSHDNQHAASTVQQSR